MKRFFLLALSLALIAACDVSGDTDGVPVRDTVDTGTATDTGTAPDTDMGTDTTEDTGVAPDSATLTDTATDAVTDATGDAVVDTGTDAMDDAMDDAVADTTPDVPSPADVPLEVYVPNELPAALPFEYSRPTAGEPLTAEEVTEFTRQITGFWKDTQFFRWVRFTSHGIDESNAEGWFDYALWWQDTQTEKQGDTVTWHHTGGADNLTLRTCKVLNNAAAGYLMFGDPDMRWIVRQYARGIAALGMGMEFGDDDPVKYVQARAIFTRNHEFDLEDGRHVVIDYDPVKHRSDGWNASTLQNAANPYWGDIWVRNQRSKDDVPHMYRSVPMLMRLVAEAPDEDVREAAALALEYLRGFARDVVDTGYRIRTKDEDGSAYVPTLDNGVDKDLASLVLYEPIDPNGECSAKLGTAYVAWGQGLDNHCGDGRGTIYEMIATEGHYFNYHIVRIFHVAAAYNAIMVGDLERAVALMEGLATRADRVLYDESMPNRDSAEWWSDASSFLLAAAAAGLPLTNDEARRVRDTYAESVANYLPFDRWDPWDPALPDGTFDYKPPRNDTVRITEMAHILEYCYSPLRNPTTAPLVDCDVVRDPARWGE